MLDKLEGLEQRYLRLEQELSNPDLVNNDQDRWRQFSKEHASLSETIAYYREFKECMQYLDEAKEILADKPDPELAELAREEVERMAARAEALEQKLKLLLVPKDPNDDKNVIMEIRGGAGGSEAALFAAEIFKMYTRFAEINGWRSEVLDSHYTDIGGIKEIIYVIEGQGAFSKLKFESGVHRVQRIPTTESGGRIHTSTVTVAVLPEAEEVEVEVNPAEIRVDTFCASGPGGQSVNTTQSAVRITHIPSGIVVSCQDEKSQLKNRDKALRVLRARLLDKYQSEQQAEVAQDRKSQVGTGDRSERIRTYNYPQSRVTDHRIGLTLHKLADIMAGNLDEIIEALQNADQASKLTEAD